MLDCLHCGESLDDSYQRCPFCGVAIQYHEGRILLDGRYTIDKELGRGAMGIVYLGTDVGLGRKVAIKIITPDYAESPGAVERFRQEAAALARVRSSYVVQVFVLGNSPLGRPFFVMEFVSGPGLGYVIDEHRRFGSVLPLERALNILRQTGTALDEVHRVGLVHRDIKPDNIILEEETGRPVLIDFGLSGSYQEFRRLSVGFGTPHYMAPEQVGDKEGQNLPPITHRSDLYSFGCTAFELLAGRAPFDGAEDAEILRRQLEAPVPPPSKFRPELTMFDPVFERALSKDPSRRFAQAADFVRALETAQRSSAPRPAATPVGPSSNANAAIPTVQETVRVMLVDDDPMFLKFASSAAQVAFFKSGARVVTAKSGPEAIDLARLEAPDLIIIDNSMPGMDGAETLRQLRTLPGGSKTQAVVLSANVFDDDRARYEAVGVHEFFSKPIPLRTLVEKLAHFAARTAAAQQARSEARPDARLEGTQGLTEGSSSAAE